MQYAVSDRTPKRQRKKEAAALRREAMRAAYLKRRRQRRLLLTTVITALALLGTGLVVLATRGGDKTTAAAGVSPSPVQASPTPAPSPEPIACDAKLPPEAGEKKPSYTKPEDQKLTAGKSYIWRLQTSCGTIDVKLAASKSPRTTNSIVFLTRKGFYDALTFHRIIPGFVAQGGDPKGDGTSGPGYTITEAPPKGVKYLRGTVAMAKTGAEPSGTSGSQFFIVHGAQPPSLAQQPVYAYAGEVVSGLDVLDKIISVGSESGTPSQKVFIEKATIIEG